VHEKTLIVPRRAVLDRNLYVVNDGRVELRKVELGYLSLTEVEVLSGVKEGEQVIVEKPERFRVGERVRVEIEK
jgi:multidrug efflux pump subunit AcrA (membrane-fusion protein)